MFQAVKIFEELWMGNTKIEPNMGTEFSQKYIWCQDSIVEEGLVHRFDEHWGSTDLIKFEVVLTLDNLRS